MSLPDPRKLTAQRIARTEAYAAKIQRMFSQTVNELLSLPLSKADAGSGQMYSFDAETERTQRKVEQLLRRLQAAATLAIQKGVTLEWEQANQAADAILKSQFSKKALASPYMKGWNARNLEAMQQFLNRSDMGMNLSQRVWQSCRQLRDEMEVALTISIGEGEDAGTISRRVRQYLNDPDLMFRRFRYKDEDGRWQTKWKKRIKDPDRPGKYRFIDYDKDSYKDTWTGKGYYKSSAKNAMRVARTETNIAYRRADHERWQGLDFVLGQRVVLSKNHPEVDICDKLSAPNQIQYDADDKRGLYPKDFVFDGWHPQCFCFVIPVMVAPEEMAKMNEAFVKGEDYTSKGEQVTEYPEEFKDWCRDNASKIKASQQRGTEPYFVRNNAEVVEEIIKAKNVGNGNVPPTLPPETSSATDDDEKKRIEGNRLFYEKLKSDPDYKDVAFNPENGGVMAIHKKHKSGSNDRFFINEDGIGITGKELEVECQQFYFERGYSILLRIEKIFGKNGNQLTSLDAEINGIIMDIRSITEDNDNTIRNSIKKKNRQLRKFNEENGTNYDCLTLHFHDPKMYSYEKIHLALNELHSDNPSFAINEVWCSVKGFKEIIKIRYKK